MRVLYDDDLLKMSYNSILYDQLMKRLIPGMSIYGNFFTIASRLYQAYIHVYQHKQRSVRDRPVYLAPSFVPLGEPGMWFTCLLRDRTTRGPRCNIRIFIGLTALEISRHDIVTGKTTVVLLDGEWVELAEYKWLKKQYAAKCKNTGGDMDIFIDNEHIRAAVDNFSPRFITFEMKGTSCYHCIVVVDNYRQVLSMTFTNNTQVPAEMQILLLSGGFIYSRLVYRGQYSTTEQWNIESNIVTAVSNFPDGEVHALPLIDMVD